MSISNTVEQALAQALQEGRQPDCPYCGKPLRVAQTQREYIRWEWNRARRRFVQAPDGDVDDPYCLECFAADENFLAFTSEVSGLCEKLGLDY